MRMADDLTSEQLTEAPRNFELMNKSAEEDLRQIAWLMAA
jgi:hypothetical protein